MCVLSLLVCCFLFSEVKFLDLLEDDLPQNHLPRLLSLITNEGEGIEDINRRRNHKPCRLDIFSSTFGGYYVCRLFTLSTMAEEEVTEVVADNGRWFCWRCLPRAVIPSTVDKPKMPGTHYHCHARMLVDKRKVKRKRKKRKKKKEKTERRKKKRERRKKKKRKRQEERRQEERRKEKRRKEQREEKRR